MNILFVADPLEAFQTYKDTTFSMMREAQRRGHAKTVVSSLLRQAWELGARQAYLQVQVENVAARRLYAQFGFAHDHHIVQQRGAQAAGQEQEVGHHLAGEAALRRAVEEQLGVTLLDVTPIQAALAGAGAGAGA